MRKRYLAVMFLVILLIPKVALADMGPKATLKIIVNSAPKGTYYLDLLVSDADRSDSVYNPDGYNEELYRMLWDYDEDGYQAALVHKVFVHMYGTLIEHQFINPPSSFKVIIVSEDGIRVSELYRTKLFSEVIHIDYQTMIITPHNQSVLPDWLLQFAQTFSVTLLIEGVILMLFGFKLKDNWKPLLLVNLISQVFLIVSMGLIMLCWGAFAYLFFFVFAEAAILVAESYAYKKFLRREKPSGRVAYAITANLISLFASFAMIYLSSL